jgi:hypothetical protein
MADARDRGHDEMTEPQSWVEPLLELRDVPESRGRTIGQAYPTPTSNATLRRWVAGLCVIGIVAIAIALVAELA